MKSVKFKILLFFTITSLVFSQNGQSGRFEYEVYSSGGSSSFIGADTLGMTADQKAVVKEAALHGVPSDNKQSGLLEYETTGIGGNSSLVSADTLGMTIDQKTVIKEASLYGVPSDNKQSGLFEYKTTGPGGNHSLVGIDPSGFNESDKANHLKATHTAPLKENIDYFELEDDVDFELAKGE